MSYTNPKLYNAGFARRVVYGPDDELLVISGAKAALEAKLVGYEVGFPQSAGGKKDAATLAVAVKSAEHIPVPKEKLQAANEAVVLLLNGQPVQSLQRGGLTFVPVELIEGAAADSFEVVMEAPTLLYRTNAEARARKEQQIRDAAKGIADAKAILAELQQALTRSKTAFKEAVDASADPDGNSELNDIGAIAIEKRRIKMEIAKQQVTQTTQEKQLADLQKLSDSQLQLTEHRITPKFRLQSGFTYVPTSADVHDRFMQSDRAEQLVQVLRKAQLHALQASQFTHSSDESK